MHGRPIMFFLAAISAALMAGRCNMRRARPGDQTVVEPTSEPTSRSTVLIHRRSDRVFLAAILVALVALRRRHNRSRFEYDPSEGCVGIMHFMRVRDR